VRRDRELEPELETEPVGSGQDSEVEHDLESAANKYRHLEVTV